MKKTRKFRFGRLILPLLGAALCVRAILSLLALPGYNQLVFTTDASPKETAELFSETKLSRAGLLGVSTEQSVGSVSGVTVYMAGEGYLDISPVPVSAGEPLSAYCVLNRLPYCLADEETAFMLFGSDDVLGKTLSYGGTEYTLMGTVDFRRAPGDVDGHCLWIPFGSTETKPLYVEIVSDSLTAEELREAFGEGSALSLHKEKLRGLILPGAVLLLLSLMLIRQGVKLFMRELRAYVKRVKKRREEMYLGRVLWHSLPGALALLLCAAAGVGVCALLLKFFVSPVYVFTEWVPENLVSMDSILARIRENCAAAAAPVRYTTRELANIRFRAGALRWGTVLLTASGLIHALEKKIAAKIDR